MVLGSAIKISDKKVNAKIADTLLKKLTITPLDEMELFSYYRKYNTKVKELEVYKNIEFDASKNGEVAQLARASDSYPSGREFESPSCYHMYIKNCYSSFLFIIKTRNILVFFYYII